MLPLILQLHHSGFFSCASIRLFRIIKFFNENKQIPLSINGSKSFIWYKIEQNNIDDDITYDYFQHYDDNNISITYENDNDFSHEYQFVNYSTIEYNKIIPFVKKYFSPSNDIIEKVSFMEDKYILNDRYENICVIFYRGNDKNTETQICGYDEYLLYAKRVLQQQPSIIFLLQSDETEFLETMTKEFPTNSFYFKDEIRHMRKCNSSVDIMMRQENHIYSKWYLAITIIMSKCKYIICGSGNCSLWIMLFRGHNENVFQNLNGKWYES